MSFAASGKYEHLIHQDSILYAGGQHNLIEMLCWNIRCYKAIKEEMTAGVYILPNALQRLLSLDADDGKEESYT